MAEEKKTPKEGTNQKLSYEQLEAYANQTAIQANRIIQENKELRKELERISTQTNFAEINLAFKVLEYEKFFSQEFIQKVVKRLEVVLTPMNEEQEEDSKKEE